MELCFSDDIDFDESSINNVKDLQISVQMITHSLPHKTQEFMGTLLKKYLTECGKESYFNKLNYCLSELLVNAIKANIKRIHFQELNLDINNDSDYEKGMKTFRQELLAKKDYYLGKLRDSNLTVTYSLKIENTKLIIEVRNNVALTTKEAARVKEKMEGAFSYKIEDFTDNIIDETEGAGLGIKSIILTLRSFGLPGDHYQLFTEGNDTVTRLIIEQPII